MSSIYKYVIVWKDAKGVEQRKDYDDDGQVKKAERWLKDNGVTDIEILVSLHNAPKPRPADPAPVAPEVPHADSRIEPDRPEPQPLLDPSQYDFAPNL